MPVVSGSKVVSDADVCSGCRDGTVVPSGLTVTETVIVSPRVVAVAEVAVPVIAPSPRVVPGAAADAGIDVWHDGQTVPAPVSVPQVGQCIGKPQRLSPYLVLLTRVDGRARVRVPRLAARCSVLPSPLDIPGTNERSCPAPAWYSWLTPQIGLRLVRGAHGRMAYSPRIWQRDQG
jgi:hypothetical protein